MVHAVHCSSRAGSSKSAGSPFHAEHAPLTRAHMVHYVDVHLPWSHSLCACCLPRMLRPAPPTAFQISSLASLRKHLQKPVVRSMPPFRFGLKPPRFITAYSAAVPLSAPPLRPPSGSRARGTTGARDTAGTRGTAGDRGTRAAGSPRLWWCCWLCIDCWTRYRRAMSIAAFIVLVAKFPRFVALWRSHVQSSSVIFPHLAFHFGAGRQAQDDCVALLLLHVLGVKGKEQLETGFAAHLLPLLPGGRDAHPMFANNAAIVFFDCAAHRHKESVEDAAVEGAVNRLAAGERGTVGNGVQGRGKQAVEPEAPTVSPAATAAGSTAWAALALGPYAEGRIKPILRSRTEVEAFIKLTADTISPAPACSRCYRYFCQYYRVVKHTAIAASFAYCPSSTLLHCLLSLSPARSATFKSLLEKLHVPRVPAVVPDSLVEGVAEEKRLRLLFVGMLHMSKENAIPKILEPIGGGKGVGRVGREESEDYCEGMWRAIMEDEALRAAGKDAGKKEKGRAGASYLEPWPGGVNPLACLREMLLGETSYCPQGKVDALAAADAAGAATAEGHGDKGGWRGCASAQCGEVEGAGVQLKLCSRCGKAAYCNRECQRAHSPSHKLTCQPKGKEKVEE
ncbi:unnamed protein product [Closterium sp. NIES-65]|nr:unnamed protein product [Closterium sp. NIES-65]